MPKANLVRVQTSLNDHSHRPSSPCPMKTLCVRAGPLRDAFLVAVCLRRRFGSLGGADDPRLPAPPTFGFQRPEYTKCECKFSPSVLCLDLSLRATIQVMTPHSSENACLGLDRHRSAGAAGNEHRRQNEHEDRSYVASPQSAVPGAPGARTGVARSSRPAGSPKAACP